MRFSEITCPEILLNETKLSFSTNHNKVNGSTSFSCAEGWRLDNENSVLRCNEHGEWEGEIPQCTGMMVLSANANLMPYKCSGHNNYISTKLTKLP